MFMGNWECIIDGLPCQSSGFYPYMEWGDSLYLFWLPSPVFIVKRIVQWYEWYNNSCRSKVYQFGHISFQDFSRLLKKGVNHAQVCISMWVRWVFFSPLLPHALINMSEDEAEGRVYWGVAVDQETGAWAGNPAGSLRCGSSCHGFGSRRSGSKAWWQNCPAHPTPVAHLRKLLTGKGPLGAAVDKTRTVNRTLRLWTLGGSLLVV